MLHGQLTGLFHCQRQLLNRLVATNVLHGQLTGLFHCQRQLLNRLVATKRRPGVSSFNQVTRRIAAKTTAVAGGDLG